MWKAIPAAALLAAAQPAAQTKSLIYPYSFAHTEGIGGTSIPFGLSAPVRLQTVYQPWAVDQVPRTIVELALRPDWSAQTGRDTIPAKAWVHLAIYMGHARLPYDRVQPDFGLNRGADLIAVFKEKAVALPAQGKLAAGPRPFAVRFKLDRPFVHVQTKGPLLIEYVVTRQPAGDYRLDSTLVCRSSAADFGKLGLACVVSGTGKPLQLGNGPSFMVGGKMDWRLSGAPPEAVCVFVLGSHEPPGKALGLPTPAHLGPYGAPGCYLNTDWLVVTGRIASKLGTAGFTFPIPKGRDFWHRWFYCQAVAADVKANRLGFVTSLGRKVRSCGPIRTARVFAVGDVTKQKTGVVQIGAAPIIELVWR